MIQAWRVYRWALIVLASTCAAGAEQNNRAAQAKPCSEPEQKRLDFWVGEWDLTWPGTNAADTSHGTHNIQRILDGCVVEEDFSGGDAMRLRGGSVSTFDMQANKWKQTWVDNEGGYLDFVGEFKNRQMMLSREAPRPDGTKVFERMVFKNITREQFDWS